MEVSVDEIANVVLKKFDSWEPKRKPLTRSKGVKEWVPLSGIVAQGRDSLTCLSAATGMKCLPQKSISQAQGIVLHDWHAEALAIRSFNRFLLEECYALTVSKRSSEFVRIRKEYERTDECFQPFELNEGIDLHMYCSEAPCGDASMELTMASQEDSTPWDLPAVSPTIPLSPSDPPTPADMSAANSETQSILHGRSYFSALGIVRRKPSRPDAPPTLSKSCTDKITLKQSLSLLSSLTSLLISPKNMYIHTLVLPSSQLSRTAVTRAFSSENGGRLRGIEEKGKEWGGGYGFRPFRVMETEREFMYSRRQNISSPGITLVPSNISSYSTPLGSETLIGGTVQGRKQFSLKGASKVCKKRMWKLALEVAMVVGVPVFEKVLRGGVYENVKSNSLLTQRDLVKRDVREKLGGWVRNDGGDRFDIEGVDV